MIDHLGRADVVGVWVGGGELAERISHLASKQPAGRIVLAGERRDVPEILPAFDIFALPSRYEGLPTAVVEAMVCGIPVVATAVNSVADVVVPGETGLLVPPQRPDLMADAVRYLIDRPAVAARMAVTARAGLGERFGMSALRNALAEAYAGSSADDMRTTVTRALIAGNSREPATYLRLAGPVRQASEYAESMVVSARLRRITGEGSA